VRERILRRRIGRIKLGRLFTAGGKRKRHEKKGREAAQTAGTPIFGLFLLQTIWHIKTRANEEGLFKMFRRLSAIALFALLVGAAGTGTFVRAEDADADFVALTPAEDLPVLAIEDGQGKSILLKDFRGRYVLLNLWASWCGPCAAEMPALDALAAKLDPAKFAVVALNEDHDGADLARSFYKRHGIVHLAAYIDADGRAPVRLHARGLPTTLLIGPDGLAVARLEGETDWTSPAMLQYLAALAR
jgi:thiol-disulfide isomerase/thioredoxin